MTWSFNNCQTTSSLYLELQHEWHGKISAKTIRHVKIGEHCIGKGNGKAILMVKGGKFKNNHKKSNKYMGKGMGKETSKAKISTHALQPRGGVTKERNHFHCVKTIHYQKLKSILG